MQFVAAERVWRFSVIKEAAAASKAAMQRQTLAPIQIDKLHVVFASRMSSEGDGWKDT